jgi:sulfatase maturation enzyme AslB (radical SAM superfamily)
MQSVLRTSTGDKQTMIHRESLDVGITHTCNNKCANCSHAAPFAPEYWIDIERLKEQLDTLKPILSVDMLHILGGEPLLHKKLPEIIKICADSKIGKEVVVITNGRLLYKMGDDFWKAISGNYIRISRYANLDIEKVALFLLEKQRSYSFGWIHHNFPWFYKQLRNNPPEESFAKCIWKNKCLTVHEGRLYRCAQSAFWPGRYMPQVQEGIPLEGITEEKLMGLLDNNPIETCKYCDASDKTEPWHEVNTLEEWVKDSTWQ